MQGDQPLTQRPVIFSLNIILGSTFAERFKRPSYVGRFAGYKFNAILFF